MHKKRTASSTSPQRNMIHSKSPLNPKKVNVGVNRRSSECHTGQANPRSQRARGTDQLCDAGKPAVSSYHYLPILFARHPVPRTLPGPQLTCRLLKAKPGTMGAESGRPRHSGRYRRGIESRLGGSDGPGVMIQRTSKTGVSRQWKTQKT